MRSMLPLLLLPARCLVASSFASSRLARSRPAAAGVAAARFRSSTVTAAATAGEPAMLKRLKVSALFEQGEAAVGATVLLKGWVRTVRDQKAFSFVEINDGSSILGLQVVARSELDSYAVVQELSTGAAVSVVGEVVASPAKGQSIEVRALSVELVGGCPADTYPLQKKRHSLEFLRTIAHLRPRTNLIGAVARVRSELAQATHAFFASEGFKYVQTPLLTASDCEGAGEMFRVTTLPVGGAAAEAPAAAVAEAPALSGSALAELEASIASQAEAVRELKAAGAPKPDVAAGVAALMGLKGRLPEGHPGAAAPTKGKGKAAAAAAAAESAAPSVADPFGDDFFGKATYLTVSGQLSAETYACALGDVYTFGPTFRAEESNTARHLAEFWMIEPEMAFADMADDMDNAEAYVKYVVRHVRERCADDLGFFAQHVDKSLLARLEAVAEQPFARVSYTEAVGMLQAEIAKDPAKWEYPEMEFGTDLATEHERWLSEVAFGRATFVYDYPKAIKSFYMRDNDDGLTVAAFDCLVPGVGELIGGSQREERLDVLRAKMADGGLSEEDYWWYLDLRRYGSVPHSGYGLGFERLVCYVTGVANIRDAIAFPRYPGSCEF